MTEEEKKAKKDALRWHFWFALSFSALLLAVFVWYLPLRFLHSIEVNNVGMYADHANGGDIAHGPSVYHEEGTVSSGIEVNLNATPAPFASGTTTRLDFLVNSKPGNLPIPYYALEVNLAKLMHVIGVREDLNEFFHIHPEPVSDRPNLFTIDHVFKKPGLYKIWSEIKKDGIDHVFGHPPLSVEGEGERPKKEIIMSRSVVVDSYQVSIHYDDPVSRGVNADILFEIHDSQGREAAIEPYLEAQMHLSIIKDDWKQFLHVHPVRSGRATVPWARAFGEGATSNGIYPLTDAPRFKENMFTFIPLANANGAHTSTDGAARGVSFSVVFPEAGIYKVFAQFRPQGIKLHPDDALMAEFWMKVEERTSPVSSPLLYTAISLILIALLSLGVKKYLKGFL